MQNQRAETKNAKAAVSKRNQRYYEKTKGAQDQVLMRLNKGERAILDSAALAAGLTKAAFFQLYLAPMAAVLTPERLQRLNRLTLLRKISISTAVARLIDAQLSQLEASVETDLAASAEVSIAFDSLFAKSFPPEPAASEGK